MLVWGPTSQRLWATRSLHGATVAGWSPAKVVAYPQSSWLVMTKYSDWLVHGYNTNLYGVWRFYIQLEWGHLFFSRSAHIELGVGHDDVQAIHLDTSVSIGVEFSISTHGVLLNNLPSKQSISKLLNFYISEKSTVFSRQPSTNQLFNHH